LNIKLQRIAYKCAQKISSFIFLVLRIKKRRIK